MLDANGYCITDPAVNSSFLNFTLNQSTASDFKSFVICRVNSTLGSQNYNLTLSGYSIETFPPTVNSNSHEVGITVIAAGAASGLLVLIVLVVTLIVATVICRRYCQCTVATNFVSTDIILLTIIPVIVFTEKERQKLNYSMVL